MTPPTPFNSLLHERLKRLFAIRKLSEVVMGAVAQANHNPASPFAHPLRRIGESLPASYDTLGLSSLPEIRAVGFTEGLILIAMIAEIEGYLQDLAILVLQRYPEKMGRNTIDICTLAALESIQDAIEHAARAHVEKMMFGSPKQYKKDLQDILSFRAPTLDEPWKAFAEAKARRDVGVHNGWRNNAIYSIKMKDIGVAPSQDESLLPDHSYLNNVVQKAQEVMEQLCAHCNATFA